MGMIIMMSVIMTMIMKINSDEVQGPGHPIIPTYKRINNTQGDNPEGTKVIITSFYDDNLLY